MTNEELDVIRRRNESLCYCNTCLHHSCDSDSQRRADLDALLAEVTTLRTSLAVSDLAGRVASDEVRRWRAEAKQLRATIKATGSSDEERDGKD